VRGARGISGIFVSGLGLNGFLSDASPPSSLKDSSSSAFLATAYRPVTQNVTMLLRSAHSVTRCPRSLFLWYTPRRTCTHMITKRKFNLTTGDTNTHLKITELHRHLHTTQSNRTRADTDTYLRAIKQRVTQTHTSK